MIIIVFGLPGSGKSYFASRLADKLDAKYINSDVVRLSIFPKRRYTNEEKEQVYAAMAREAESSIRKDKHIVLDATFYRKSIRERFIQLAKRSDKTILFIEVIAEESIIRERLSVKRTYSEADYSVYLTVKEAFEPFKQDHLVLQSTQENIDEMLVTALNYIGKSNGKSAGR